MTRSYQLNIITRIMLIVLVSIAGGWYLSAGESLYNIIFFVIILTVQIINLIFYVNRINKKINYFFESVKNEDYSLVFPEHKEDKTLYKLSRNLRAINELIQNIQIENRSQEQYFGAMIEHVDTGIFSLTKDGFVIHANSSLKKILGLKQFTHLRQLEKIDGKLAGAIRNPKQHDEKLITFKGKKEVITLMIKASAFKSKGQILTLISVQDIKKELDEKELDSWLKLIRVLTHEIMNSIAPVTSLSENLYNYYTKKEEAISVADVDEKLITMTIKGLKVIQEQGQGLTRFVESYRELTRLPKPRKNMITISHLLEKTVMLCKSYLPCKGIKISWGADDNDLQIYVDENQISQVLINLLKNSAEALHDAPAPEIRLHSRINAAGQAEIEVTDNGPGISPELTDEIFVPFFTTRENGSGIGLSLSRQIMRLHGGSLKVHSIPDKETTFTLVFI